MSHKQREAIAWRRNKVQDLLVQGLGQYEIAEILKVSQPTINNDVQFLREKAKQSMQTHVEHTLPTEFQNCFAGINKILKMAWQIANNYGDKNKIKVEDKIRLQALALANECYKYKMDLVTNGVIVSNAFEFVQGKKEAIFRMMSLKCEAAQETNTSDPNSHYCQQNTTNRLF